MTGRRSWSSAPGWPPTRLVERPGRPRRRRRDDVTVLGDEPHAPYNRILLSAVLEGTHRPEALTLRSPSWYADARRRPAPRRPRRSSRPRASARSMLADGSRVRLRRAGARHRLDPDACRRSAGWSGWTAAARAGARLPQPRRLPAPRRRGAAPRARRAVVVGGGLLGLQVARALSVRGLATEVVEGGEHLLRSQVGAAAGADPRPRPASGSAPPSTPAPAPCGSTDARPAARQRLHPRHRPRRAHRRRPPVDRAGPARRARRAPRHRRRRPAAHQRRPRIHAIGDCAEHGGQVTGFVPPAWEQAGLLAAPPGRRATCTYAGARTVARLRATDLDVAVLGDPETGRGRGRRGRPTRSSARTASSSSATASIVAATLVGDLSRIGLITQHYDRGTVLGPHEPGDLLMAERPAPPAALPDDAEVCACAGVTAGRSAPAPRSSEVRDDHPRHHRLRRLRPAVRQLLATRSDPARPDHRTWKEPARDGHTSARPSSSSATAWSATASCRPPIERGLTETYDVVVVGEEPRPAYDRVALTSFFEVGADALSLLPDGAYDDPRVRLRARHRGRRRSTPRPAPCCSPTARCSAYDELVLATGAAPFVPPIPGHDLDGCFVYRTIEDLEAIREAAAGATVGAVDRRRPARASRPPTRWPSSASRPTSSRWRRG